MKVSLVITLALAVMACASVGKSDPVMPPKIEALYKKFSPGYNAFSINYYQLLGKQVTGNVALCPVATQRSLALVLAGAKGRTQLEIRKAMSYTLNNSETKKFWISVSKYMNFQSGGYKSTGSNFLFVDNDFPIREGYKAIAENYYRSVTKVVDFAKPRPAAYNINAEVKKHCPKIENLVEPQQLSKTTRLALINTVHVSAKWLHPFKLADTKPGIFTIAPGKTRKVNFMKSTRTARFGYDEVLGAKFLELKLSGVQMTVVFVLPDKKHGLAELEGKIKRVLAFKDFEDELVNINIPRVNFQTHANLRTTLQRLGIRRAFNPNLAELSGISTKRGLYLNVFLQKTFVTINEGGLNAQVAEAATISSRSVANASGIDTSFKVNFIADHPFLFYLKVAPGCPILIGRVTTPDPYKEPVNPRNIEDKDDNDDRDDNNNDEDDEE